MTAAVIGALLAMIFAALALPAGAETVFVDAARGRDDNPGSSPRPLATIQAGIDLARAGDSVRIATGTYREALRTVRDGRADAPIRIEAVAPGRVVVISGDSALSVSNDHVVVRGLVLDGAMGPNPIVRTGRSSRHVTLHEVEIRNAADNCLELDGLDITLDSCRIHHCLRRHPVTRRVIDAHAITGHSIDGLTVRGCDIYYFSGDGIQLSPPRQRWDRLVVEDTRFWIAPLPAPAGDFVAGELVGENAFDSKTPSDGPRPRVVFRDVEAHGFAGVIRNQAAFNVKERVDFEIDGARVHGNELAFRLRGPARAVLRAVEVWDNRFSIRYEDGLPLGTITASRFRDARPFKNGGGRPPRHLDVSDNTFIGLAKLPLEAPAGRGNRLSAH